MVYCVLKHINKIKIRTYNTESQYTCHSQYTGKEKIIEAGTHIPTRGNRRLSWPGWLVTYRNKCRARWDWKVRLAI